MSVSRTLGCGCGGPSLGCPGCNGACGGGGRSLGDNTSDICNADDPDSAINSSDPATAAAAFDACAGNNLYFTISAPASLNVGSPAGSGNASTSPTPSTTAPATAGGGGRSLISPLFSLDTSSTSLLGLGLTGNNLTTAAQVGDLLLILALLALGGFVVYKVAEKV